MKKIHHFYNSFCKRFSHSLLGLDIQKHIMRLVQLRKIKNDYRIEQAISIRLSPDIVIDNKIKSWDTVTHLLGEQVKKHDLTRHHTVINLSANQVSVQHLTLPLGIPHSAILSEIHTQVERDFPGLLDALTIDFSVLENKESGYLQVWFAVSRKDYISKFIKCINNAGLNVKIIDIDIYSLKRIFDSCLPELSKQKTTHAIICHDNNIISLIVYEIHEIIFYHQWASLDEVHCAEEIKSKLLFFCASHPNKIIQHFIIYNIALDLHDLLHGIVSEFETHYLSPSLKIKFRNMEKIDNYLLACGAAMRKCPLW